MVVRKNNVAHSVSFGDGQQRMVREKTNTARLLALTAAVYFLTLAFVITLFSLDVTLSAGTEYGVLENIPPALHWVWGIIAIATIAFVAVSGVVILKSTGSKPRA
ncbi:MAG: hypothetical protein FWE38_01035 [Firmicutes bacterium]|nr:hypothetical protein [Bacillota bacterium]